MKKSDFKRAAAGYFSGCRLRSDEKFTAQRFSERSADCYDNQPHSDNQAGCQRIDRPYEGLMQRKGMIQKEFNQQRKKSRRNESTAENKKVTSFQIIG